MFKHAGLGDVRQGNVFAVLPLTNSHFQYQSSAVTTHFEFRFRYKNKFYTVNAAHQLASSNAIGSFSETTFSGMPEDVVFRAAMSADRVVYFYVAAADEPLYETYVECSNRFVTLCVANVAQFVESSHKDMTRVYQPQTNYVKQYASGSVVKFSGIDNTSNKKLIIECLCTTNTNKGFLYVVNFQNNWIQSKFEAYNIGTLSTPTISYSSDDAEITFTLNTAGDYLFRVYRSYGSLES